MFAGTHEALGKERPALFWISTAIAQPTVRQILNKDRQLHESCLPVSIHVSPARASRQRAGRRPGADSIESTRADSVR